MIVDFIPTDLLVCGSATASPEPARRVTRDYLQAGVGLSIMSRPEGRGRGVSFVGRGSIPGLFFRASLHGQAPETLRGLEPRKLVPMSQVFGARGRPRVSAALSSLRTSEAELLAGLRRSLARTSRRSDRM